MKIQADPNKIEALSERMKRSRRTLESLFSEATRIARNTVGSARSAYPEHRGVQSASNELERIIAQIRQEASQLDLLLANQAKQLYTIASTYRRQEQEASRILLRKFSKGTKASIASNEMQKQVAHLPDAWPYDPMYEGNVPILPNQHYQHLLELAATDSIEGDQAFSQLQAIKVAREELGQAYRSLLTHVQEANASGCWQDIFRVLEVAKKLNEYNLFTQPPQYMEPQEHVPKEELHWWDKIIGDIQNLGEEAWAGLQKFGESVKEIGMDFTHDATDRAEKAWDSPYDFVNYWTFGIPDLVVGTYDGMEERAAKWDESVYDFSNWLTFGTVEMVDGALFPREALSREHLYNVIGLGILLAPMRGMIISKGAGKTVEAGEVQILGRENDVYSKQIDEGTGEVKLTEPTSTVGGKPKGKYEKPDPNEPNPITRQNESADLLAEMGYDVEMLPNNHKKGNGYGIKPDSNPDFLINGEPFDCYSPDTSNVRNIWSTVDKKTKEQASRIVMNLDDFKGSMDALVKQFSDWRIEDLDELLIIKDGKITRLIPK